MEAALAGVVHDIRTPLTGIVALAELLAASDLGARERAWASAIKSGADHLTALTTLIVDAVKTDAAGLTLQYEPFAPRRLAEAVAEALTARAGNKGIATEIAIADDLPALVAGDALRLRAVLENLADNAVKFTHEGTVAFGAAAVARRYGGAGLGLVFVKRVTEAMGGSLGVTSKPGHGTSFRLAVPVDRVEVSPQTERAGAHAAAARVLSILCAEDNPYGRVVMNTILGELGHRVAFVESGEAAVDAVSRGSYDAVLMDVVLAGLDGIAATRRIRALPGQASRMPVIGISGGSESGEEAAARAAGMNFYLLKPISPSTLAQALATISPPLSQK